MKNLKALTPQAWPSIIQGVGLMIILVAIFFAWDAVIRGLNTKIEHGKTKITVSQKPNPESE